MTRDADDVAWFEVARASDFCFVLLLLPVCAGSTRLKNLTSSLIVCWLAEDRNTSGNTTSIISQIFFVAQHCALRTNEVETVEVEAGHVEAVLVVVSRGRLWIDNVQFEADEGFGVVCHRFARELRNNTG